MWCLKGREDLCVYILPNQKKSFGKSLSDIKLEGDVTISRLHAVISVESAEESETQYKCVINDVSKYGTFVIRDKEKKKLVPNNKFVLEAGDIVQFGLKESTFVVLYHSFIIARSSLEEQDTKKLKDIVHDLNATLSETWENFCTHLTVAKSTLFTTKLACALASSKPIVTNAYWEAVNVAVKESKELPQIEDFLPNVKEEWLKVCSRMFLPNEKRRTLFKGLSFVHFCARQYFTYAPLITAAGGKSCVYPTKRPLTPRDLTAKNAIVIQQPANDSSQFTQVIAADYPIIYHKLQAVKRRMVSDTEIPLAILYCSTEMYCNPKYDFTIFLKSETPKFSSDMMIENTQAIADTKQIKRKIIPETCLESYENVSKKICCFDENEKNISSVNESNIVITQNIDNKESKRKIIPETCESHENVSKKIRCFDENEKNISSVNESNIVITQNIDRESKCKIIPETCDSEINKKISHSSFYENEWKCKSDINESVAMNNMQNVDNKEMKRKIISDSQINENMQIQYFNEGEQRFVSNTDRSNVLVKTRKNISDSNKSNIVNNTLPYNANKQFQIIPDSCSVEKNSDIFSSKSNKVQIVLETCEFNEEFVGNNFITEKEQQKIELQEKESFKKSNVTFTKNQEKSKLQENESNFQQQKSSIINENNTTFENNNLDRQKNSKKIVEKDNLNNYNSKFPITKWENSKNVKTSHPTSIKEVNDSEIEVKQGREYNLFKTDRSRVELQSLKEQKLSPVCNSEKNRQDKEMKQDKIQTKDKKKEEPRKIGNKEKYLNQELTDEILRKDVPCGKKFIKISVMKPKRILRVEDGDFIL